MVLRRDTLPPRRKPDRMRTSMAAERNLRRMARIVAVFVSALILIGFYVILSDRSRMQRLPDGATLRVAAVRCGSMNAFKHGTWLEKILEPIIPPKGFTLGKLR